MAQKAMIEAETDRTQVCFCLWVNEFTGAAGQFISAGQIPCYIAMFTAYNDLYRKIIYCSLEIMAVKRLIRAKDRLFTDQHTGCEQKNVWENATALGGVLPLSPKAAVAMVLPPTLWDAFPDFHVELQRVETCGSESTVTFRWGGTNNGWLQLPNVAPIPPTHCWAWVEDACVFRFEGTQVVSVRFVTPACGGLAGMLAQLEITIP